MRQVKSSFILLSKTYIDNLVYTFLVYNAYMNCRYCISTALEDITISRPVLLLFHVGQTLDTSYYLVIAMMVKGNGLKREIVASLNLVLLNNLWCYSIFFFIIGHLVSQITDYH